MSIESTKLEIIKIIIALQNEDIVKQLLLFLSSIDEKDALAIAKIPTPESIDLGLLKKIQGYDTEKLSQAHKAIDHELWKDEDLEELLKAI
ncbi:MAG: hypothetical protein AAF806_09765 [Bacteroidota bacterium]